MRRSEKPFSRIASGVVVTDLSLTPVALDEGGVTILSDIDSSDGIASASCVPQQLHDAINGRAKDNLSGVRIAIQGAHARYRCVIHTVQPFGSRYPEPMLILHFQRSLSVEDAIDHLANAFNLTGREVVVLRGLSNGLTSKEIATEMKISPNTVKSYIRLIMVKIGATTRSGIVGKLLEFISI